MEIFINLILHILFTGCYFICVAIIVLFIKYIIKLKGVVSKDTTPFLYGLNLPFTIFHYWWTAVIALVAFLVVALIGLSVLKSILYSELLANNQAK